MKVFHIIDSGGFYGAESMVLDLMEQQKELKHEPTLCSIGDYKKPTKKIEEEAAKRKLSIIPIRMRNGLNIYGIHKFLSLAINNKVDIIHSHGYKPNILLGLLPKRFRIIPIVCTLHGWTDANKISRLKLYYWLESKLLNRLDAIVLVNNEMKSKIWIMESNIDDKKIHVIDNGINLKSKILPKDYDINSNIINKFINNSFVVGAIGRLDSEKCYSVLIEAIKILHEKQLDIKLVLIGEGNLKSELENLVIKYSLQDKVLITGYLDYAKSYMKLFNAFVISSSTEGLPITLLDAMNNNVPVIATKVGGIPNVIENGESGILIPPGHPEEISNNIELIMGSKHVQNKLTMNANSRLNKYYTSAAMTRKYIKVYNILKN